MNIENNEELKSNNSLMKKFGCFLIPLPYIAVFLMDILLFPVLFHAVVFKFFIDVFILIILGIITDKLWHYLFVALILSAQIWHCWKICDFSSWIGYVIVLYEMCPLWGGYALASLCNRMKHSE